MGLSFAKAIGLAGKYDYSLKVVVMGAEPDKSALINKLVNSTDQTVTYLTVARSDLTRPDEANTPAIYKLRLYDCQSYQPAIFKRANIIIVVTGSRFGNEHLIGQLLTGANLKATVVVVTNEVSRKVRKEVTNAVIDYNFDFADAKQVNQVMTDIIDVVWVNQLVQDIKRVI